MFQLNVAVPVPENAAAKDFVAFRAASETFYLIASYFSSQLKTKKPSFVFFNLLFLLSHGWLLVAESRLLFDPNALAYYSMAEDYLGKISKDQK